MPQLNEEQQKDVAERKQAFDMEYKALCTKYQIEIMTKPDFVPTQGGFFGIVVMADFVDLKYRVPSPIKIGK